METETKKISLYHPDGLGDSYDTGIPIDLYEVFSKLKEEMHNKSNGVFQCTPMVFNPNSPGASTCIVENKNGQSRKTEYTITLNKKQLL